MDHFQDLGEGQDVGQVAHDEIVVDPRPRDGTRKGLQHLIDVERLVRGRVDRGELGEGQQDDGGMDPGVALDGVHLAVPLGQDEIERKVTGETTLFAAGDGVLGEPVEEISGPLFGPFPDLSVGPVLIGHEHVVTGRSDESGDLAIHDRGVCAPFCEIVRRVLYQSPRSPRTWNVPTRLTLTGNVFLQDVGILSAHLQLEPVKVFPSLAHLSIIPSKRVRRQIPPVLVELGTLDDEPHATTVLVLGFRVEEVHGLVHGIDEFTTRNRKSERIDQVDKLILVVQLRDGLGVLDEGLASTARLDRHGLGGFGVLDLGSDSADGKEEVDVVFDS
jgi:hypothetical protein